jgi:HEAT repeat protein
MKRFTAGASGLLLVLAGVVLAPVVGGTQSPATPLEKYRHLEFPPKEENFDKGWQERVALEYEIINAADLPSLRAALKDENSFVRAMAARALGILEDKASADALAALVKSDPEYSVRIRAVEALGFLKLKPEVIELAQKDKQLGVVWTAQRVASELKSETNYAALVRQAYAGGIKREAMATAKVGERAPDFSALTSDGAPFKLSAVLGKKPIAIYFAAFDG